MLLGLSLLYVGAVLSLNGLWLLGKVEDREILFPNLFTGFISLCVALYDAFGPGANAASVNNAALTLLFSATYLWVAFNRASGADGRGLGWFCLFVAITLVPVAIRAIGAAQDAREIWLAWNWAAWAVLWFVFFLLLALHKPIAKPVGCLCLLLGVVTAWVPGWMLLHGVLI